ncbi:protein rds1 [Uncinocarpus reesii 1704]|uniref:Protein rds1 n=1 Tax=Uncinocarpus reesii (strain UAMH 1704) TaxID=336963 RepID=C4K085_UNCRE|nr:protein rds1 [Uncinocarpus reesii 1704]EEP82971.1 protein rds1 [Uncinocarpus reesii 1704]
MKSCATGLAVLLACFPYAIAAPATAVAPTRSESVPTSHGPFTGTPTTTGALSNSVLASSIAPLPPNPTATTYPSDGQLHEPQPAPYTPAGGLGTNGTEPIYNVRSDFDYQSLAIALYQEWLELDLFHNGLATFSEADFTAAGLTAEDRYLIQFMAEQEVGHATVISNMLGAQAPMPCAYNYPFTTVREFVDFCQKLTRFGESSVYGFLEHLDSREAATILLQSITTEARQQIIFRQFNGLFPMPVWFEVGVPQSWAWTLMAPYISWCPANQTRLAWQNFPALWILNQPNPARVNGSAGYNETLTAGMNTLSNANLTSSQACLNTTDKSNDCGPAITQNRTIPLSWPGREVRLMWDTPGKPVGPNNSYITSSQAGSAKFVAWVTQLNVTYSPLTLQSNTSNNATNGTMQMGTTIQPNVETFAGDPAINGTMFIAITDADPVLTPFNLSMINPHVVAGPALYQAG